MIRSKPSNFVIFYLYLQSTGCLCQRHSLSSKLLFRSFSPETMENSDWLNEEIVFPVVILYSIWLNYCRCTTRICFGPLLFIAFIKNLPTSGNTQNPVLLMTQPFFCSGKTLLKSAITWTVKLLLVKIG